MTLGKPVNLDVFAIAHNGRTAVVNQTMVRQGKVLLVENYPVTDAGLDERQTLSSFLTMYFPPPIRLAVRCCSTVVPTTSPLWNSCCTSDTAKNTSVYARARGKKQLTEMAYSNAAEQLEKVRRKATDTRQKLRAQSGTLKICSGCLPFRAGWSVTT